MKKSTTIILIVVAAFVAVFLILGATGSTITDVEYDYKIEVTDSFEDKYGNVEKPDPGYQFAILTYHIYNKSYSNGISTNPLTWQMKVNVGGLNYSWSPMETYSHPGYRLIDVPKGSDASGVQVFEVPVGYSASEMKGVLNAIFTYAKIEYNPNLAV